MLRPGVSGAVVIIVAEVPRFVRFDTLAASSARDATRLHFRRPLLAELIMCCVVAAILPAAASAFVLLPVFGASGAGGAFEEVGASVDGADLHQGVVLPGESVCDPFRGGSDRPYASHMWRSGVGVRLFGVFSCARLQERAVPVPVRAVSASTGNDHRMCRTRVMRRNLWRRCRGWLACVRFRAR